MFQSDRSGARSCEARRVSAARWAHARLDSARRGSSRVELRRAESCRRTARGAQLDRRRGAARGGSGSASAGAGRRAARASFLPAAVLCCVLSYCVAGGGAAEVSVGVESSRVEWESTVQQTEIRVEPFRGRGPESSRVISRAVIEHLLRSELQSRVSIPQSAHSFLFSLQQLTRH